MSMRAATMLALAGAGLSLLSSVVWSVEVYHFSRPWQGYVYLSAAVFFPLSLVVFFITLLVRQK